MSTSGKLAAFLAGLLAALGLGYGVGSLFDFGSDQAPVPHHGVDDR